MSYPIDYIRSDTPPFDVPPYRGQRYEDLVHHHLVPALESLPLVRLSPQPIRAMYRAKLAEGLSPTTVHTLRP